MKLIETLMTAIREIHERKRKFLVKPARNVTFAWPLEDASLMLAISQHYGKSSSSIGAEVFAPMMGDILMMLPANVREQIATDADRMIVEFIAKNKVKEEVNLTYWQDFNSKGPR